MPKIKLNLDEQTDGFQPIPEGEYEAYVFDVEKTEFRSGNDGYKITYNIAEGQYKGRRLWDNLVITPKAYWKLAQFWKAVTGLSGEVEVDTDQLADFVGKRVLVKVGIEQNTYQGKTEDRNVVKSVAFTGGMARPEDDLTAALESREVSVGEKVPF